MAVVAVSESVNETLLVDTTGDLDDVSRQRVTCGHRTTRAGTIERGAMSEELEATYRKFLDDAVTSGYEQLREGRSGLDVVASVIQLMEDSPLFNAGRGAVYTWEGTHELDASIMHGENLDAGAVAGVSNVKSPIALARAVMEDSPHVMLAGAGAEAFALEQGFDPVPPEYFSTERRRKALEAYKSNEQAGLQPEADHKFGTVGVVCWIRPAIWSRAPQPVG